MKNPIFWRLVWKEYRLMRSFWIAMALLAVFLQALAWLSVWSPNDSLPMIFTIALIMPAFYAMGCGATLFATEHETGTFQFQRSLPVSAWRLFLGKIPFGLFSTLPLFLVLWVSAWLISGMRLPSADFHLGLWALCGVAALELFLWGVFFSLLCRQPMKAAVLAALVGSTTIHAIATAGEHQWRSELYLDPRTVLYRLAIVCLLAAVNVWLGPRWFRDKSTSADDGRRSGPASIRPKTADIQRGKLATRSTVLGRLIWQQWRQSRRMMLILVAMTVPLLAFMVCNWHAFFPEAERNPTRTAVDLPIWIVLAISAAPLAGASVFMADQRKCSFRFLTERGLDSRHVWIGRHAVWILAAASWTILLVVPWMVFPVLSWMARSVFSHPGNDPLPDAAVGFAFLGGACFTYVVGAYAVGQLCSMFFKSSIMAGFFALLLSVGLVFWTVLMLGLGVPLIWSIAPIPIIFLVATWLRAPHWLLEQTGIKGWWTTATWLAVALGILLTAVPAYRVYQIPLVQPGFDPAEFSRPPTPQAQATADVYRRAGELVVPMAKRKDDTTEQTKEEFQARAKAWVDENQEVIQMALDASRRPECDALEPDGRSRLGRAADKLAHLLLRKARLLDADGDSDAGLEYALATLRMSSQIRPRNRHVSGANGIESSVYHYLQEWAAKPGQTPDRIRTAINAVQTQIANPPSQTDEFKVNYLVARRILQGEIDLLVGPLDNADRRNEDIRAIVALQWIPWERARIIRLLDRWTARQIQSVENVEQAVAQGLRLPMAAHVDYRDQMPYSDSQFGGFYETARILDRFHHLGWHWHARSIVDAATRRRATCLVLALTAWKLEHGELPENLEDLVGPYLTNLPPDPHTAEPFLYFPQGIPIPITSTRHTEDAQPGELVAAGQPFIWSTGWNISTFRTSSERLLDKYRINESYRSNQRPRSEYEIWRRGKYFTIP